MQVKPLTEIEALLRSIAEHMGIEIVEVEFKTKGSPSLTVYIDKEGGVDLNACEAFHGAIDAPLDELDPTFGASYTLNVSSPGLDRPFRTERDFQRNLGKKVEVKLYAPLRGKKYYEGTMTEFTEHTVRLDLGKESLAIERNKIAKINQAVDFGE